MKMKMNAVLAAALAVLAMGGAQAAISLPNNTTLGNGSVMFVAHNATDQMTLIVDLGLSMKDLIPGSAMLSSTASQVSWNFGADVVTSNVAGMNITGNAWSQAYNTFAAATTASEFTWGVLAGDQISGTTVTASNAIAGRGWMATGNATINQMTAANTSGPTGTGTGNILNFSAAANNTGNHLSVDNGAGIATSGTAYGAMGGDLVGASTWNYLVANGVSSTMQYQQQVVADPYVFQLGAGAHVNNTFNANPLKFTFDISTGTLVAAVPEPGTYALMLAGLLGVAFLARRRQP